MSTKERREQRRLRKAEELERWRVAGEVLNKNPAATVVLAFAGVKMASSIGLINQPEATSLFTLSSMATLGPFGPLGIAGAAVLGLLPSLPSILSLPSLPSLPEVFQKGGVPEIFTEPVRPFEIFRPGGPF